MPRLFEDNSTGQTYTFPDDATDNEVYNYFLYQKPDVAKTLDPNVRANIIEQANIDRIKRYNNEGKGFFGKAANTVEGIVGETARKTSSAVNTAIGSFLRSNAEDKRDQYEFQTRLRAEKAGKAGDLAKQAELTAKASEISKALEEENAFEKRGRLQSAEASTYFRLKAPTAADSASGPLTATRLAVDIARGAATSVPILTASAIGSLAGPQGALAAGVAASYALSLQEAIDRIRASYPDMSPSQANDLAQITAVPVAALEYAGALGQIAGALSRPARKALSKQVANLSGRYMSPELITQLSKSKLGSKLLAHATIPGAAVGEGTTELLQEFVQTGLIDGRLPTFNEAAYSFTVGAGAGGAIATAGRGASLATERLTRAKNDPDSRRAAVEETIPADVVRKNRSLVSSYVLGDIDHFKLLEELDNRGYPIDKTGGRPEFDVADKTNRDARLKQLSEADELLASITGGIDFSSEKGGQFNAFADAKITLEGLYRKLHRAVQFGNFTGFTQKERFAVRDALVKGKVIPDIAGLQHNEAKSLPADRVLPLINALQGPVSENLPVLELLEEQLYNVATNTVKNAETGETYSSVAEYVNDPQNEITISAVTEELSRQQVAATRLHTIEDSTTGQEGDGGYYAGSFEYVPGDGAIISLTIGTADATTPTHEMMHLLVHRIDPDSALAANILNFVNANSNVKYTSFSELLDTSTPEAFAKATAGQELLAEFSEVFLANPDANVEGISEAQATMLEAVGDQVRKLFSASEIFKHLGLVTDTAAAVKRHKSRAKGKAYNASLAMKQLLFGGAKVGTFTKGDSAFADAEVSVAETEPLVFTAEELAAITAPSTADTLTTAENPAEGRTLGRSQEAEIAAYVEQNRFKPGLNAETVNVQPGETDIVDGAIRQPDSAVIPRERLGAQVHFPSRQYELLYNLEKELQQIAVFDTDERVGELRRKNSALVNSLRKQLGFPSVETRGMSAEKRKRVRAKAVADAVDMSKAYQEFVKAKLRDAVSEQGLGLTHIDAPTVPAFLLSEEGKPFRSAVPRYYQELRQRTPKTREDLTSSAFQYFGPAIPIEQVAEATTDEERFVRQEFEERLANGQPFQKAVNGLFHKYAQMNAYKTNQALVDLVNRSLQVTGQLDGGFAALPDDGKKYYQTAKIKRLLPDTKVVNTATGLPLKVYGGYVSEQGVTDDIFELELPVFFLHPEAGENVKSEQPIEEQQTFSSKGVFLDLKRPFNLMNTVTPAEITDITDWLIPNHDFTHLVNASQFIQTLYEEYPAENVVWALTQAGYDGFEYYANYRDSKAWQPFNEAQIHYAPDIEQTSAYVRSERVADYNAAKRKQREEIAPRTVAVDSNGHLLRLAHGSATPPTTLKKRAVNTGFGGGGDSFGVRWLTEDSGEASKYSSIAHRVPGTGLGGNQRHVRFYYLDVRDPFDLNKNSTVETAEEIIETAHEIYGMPYSFVENVIEDNKRNLMPGKEGIRDILAEVYDAVIDHLTNTKPLPRAKIKEKAIIEDILWEMGYDSVTHIGGNGVRKWVAFSEDQLIPAPAADRRYFQEPRRRSKQRLDGRERPDWTIESVTEQAAEIYKNPEVVGLILDKAKNELLSGMSREEFVALQTAVVTEHQRIHRLVESGSAEYARREAAKYEEQLKQTYDAYRSHLGDLFRTLRSDVLPQQLLRLSDALANTKGMRKIYTQLLSSLEIQDLITANKLSGKKIDELIKLLEENSDTDLSGMQSRIRDTLVQELLAGDKLDDKKLNTAIAETIVVLRPGSISRELFNSYFYTNLLLQGSGRVRDVASNTASRMWALAVDKPIDIALDTVLATALRRPRRKYFKELLVNPFKGTLAERKETQAIELYDELEKLDYSKASAVKSLGAILRGRLATKRVESRYTDDIRTGGVYVPELLAEFGNNWQKVLGTVLASTSRGLAGIDYAERVVSEEVAGTQMRIAIDEWKKAGTYEQNMRHYINLEIEEKGVRFKKDSDLNDYIQARLDNPLIMITTAAEEFSTANTFRQKPGAITQHITKVRDEIDNVFERIPYNPIRPARHFIVPFANIVANVMKAGLKYTPASAALLTSSLPLGGYLALAGAGATIASQKVSGGTVVNAIFNAKTPGQKALREKVLAQYVSHQIAGYLLMNVLGWMLDNDLITGAPKDDDEARAWEAEGKQWYSFRPKDPFSDQRLNVPIIEPFLWAVAPTLIALSEAKVAADYGGYDSPEAVAMRDRAAHNAFRFVQNSFFLNQAMRLVSPVDNVDVGRALAGYLPFSGLFREMNDFYQYVKEGQTTHEDIRSMTPSDTNLTVPGRQIQKTLQQTYGPTVSKHFSSFFGRYVPGMEETIPEKFDYMGRPIARDEFFSMSLPWEWFPESPDLTKDPVHNEFVHINIYPDLPSQTITFKGRQIELPTDVYRSYVIRSGELINTMISRIIYEPSYQGLDVKERQDYIKDKVFSRARSIARDEVIRNFGIKTYADLDRLAKPESTL